MPRFGQRPAPLDPIGLDRTTVRELARVLAERLQQVETFCGRCPTCGDGEARAFLAKLRKLLEEMGGQTSRGMNVLPRGGCGRAARRHRLGQSLNFLTPPNGGAT